VLATLCEMARLRYVRWHGLRVTCGVAWGVRYITQKSTTQFSELGTATARETATGDRPQATTELEPRSGDGDGDGDGDRNGDGHAIGSARNGDGDGFRAVLGHGFGAWFWGA